MIWEIGEVSSEAFEAFVVWDCLVRQGQARGIHASRMGSIWRNLGAGSSGQCLHQPLVSMSHSHRAEVGAMPYPPGWERLSDAATRVMAAAGIANDEARSNICQAIADGAVEIRCKLEKHTTRPIRSKNVLAGKDFEIPTDLKLEELDWRGHVRYGGAVGQNRSWTRLSPARG